ncbi:MAG TPA: ABC transporter ATP-binding protein [Methylomirabilota bacterium]|nr:ABC transporter ATP-binding protein [Methylomirabilota bacterium]
MARIDLINVGMTIKGREPAAASGSAFTMRDLSLSVRDGETLVVLGPSGCGKTTLLRIIAGLLVPDSGEVRYNGEDMRQVPPAERRIGMVFQNYALYPHMTSRTNVLAYFLFRKKTPEMNALARRKYERTSELMGVELEHLLDRRPPTLSGGEKQRVALGRCITRDPAVFLLDEPFSNLDQALREKYRANLKVLLKQFGITTVYVTHDHVEALILADRLAVMTRGRIEQIGTYQEIYERPKNAFVAGFLNRHVGTAPISFLDARYVTTLDRPLGDAQVGVRPEDVEVSAEHAPDRIGAIVTGRLSLPMINATIVSLRVDEHEVYAQGPGDQPLQVGDRVWLTFRRYHVFDRASGARLENASRS